MQVGEGRRRFEPARRADTPVEPAAASTTRTARPPPSPALPCRLLASTHTRTPRPLSSAMRISLPFLRSSRALLATPTQITSLLHQTAHASRCPCHVCTSSSPAQAQQSLMSGLRKMGSSVVEKEYAFEVRPDFGSLLRPRLRQAAFAPGSRARLSSGEMLTGSAALPRAGRRQQHSVRRGRHQGGRHGVRPEALRVLRSLLVRR